MGILKLWLLIRFRSSLSLCNSNKIFTIHSYHELIYSVKEISIGDRLKSGIYQWMNEWKNDTSMQAFNVHIHSFYHTANSYIILSFIFHAQVLSLFILCYFSDVNFYFDLQQRTMVINQSPPSICLNLHWRFSSVKLCLFLYIEQNIFSSSGFIPELQVETIMKLIYITW